MASFKVFDSKDGMPVDGQKWPDGPKLFVGGLLKAFVFDTEQDFQDFLQGMQEVTNAYIQGKIDELEH